MRKTLIVGGPKHFTTKWAKRHLPKVGMKMCWLWDFERRNFPSFPPTVEAVIVLKEMVGHRQRDKAVAEAKRWGIPYAEVSRQWTRALPILEAKNMVSPLVIEDIIDEPKPEPKPEPKESQVTPQLPATHPDWEEYLDILLLEDSMLNHQSMCDRLAELVQPYSVTDQMRATIQERVNRKLILQSTPTQDNGEKMSVYFTNAMSTAVTVVNNLSQTDHDNVINFLTKCTTKAKPNVPSAVRSLFADNNVDNPTLFSAVVYHIFEANGCTTTPELINKAYQRITGRKHNYTKPREVFAHYDCDWTVHNTDNQASPLVETPTETPTAGLVELQEHIAQLTSSISDLTSIVTHLQSQNSALVAQMKLLSEAKEPNSNENVIIPKADLVEYIINNNKLNITIQ